MSNTNVLLIEDNPGDVLLFEEVMRRCGLDYDVTVAHDGEDALETLRGRSQVDLVVLDINLPRMSGEQLLAHVKADPRLASIPLVVLTSSTSERRLLDRYGLDADAFFVKPMSIERFMATMQQIEAYRQRQVGKTA